MLRNQKITQDARSNYALSVACPLWVISRHLQCKTVMSALPPIADICSARAHVRFVPIADISIASRTNAVSI